MGEAAFRMTDYLALKPEEQLAITDQQLTDLLTADDFIIDPKAEKDKQKEAIKPVSIAMVWMQQELTNIVATVEGAVDQPLDPTDIKAQLEFLNKRFKSIDRVVDVIKTYWKIRNRLKVAYTETQHQDPEFAKFDIASLLTNYKDAFVEGIGSYLKSENQKEFREQNTVPFPLEITKMPLALFSLSSIQESILSAYLHNLTNIFYMTAQYIKEILDPKSQTAQYLVPETILKDAQTALVDLIEFQRPFDMHEISYHFIQEPIQNFRMFLTKSYRDADKGREDKRKGRAVPKVLFLFSDTTKQALPELLGEASNAAMLEKFTSFLSIPFSIELMGNIEQNVKRVNEKLEDRGSDRLITEVETRIEYHEYPITTHPLVENQVRRGENGVWITIKVTDNGPGFPAEAQDSIYTIQTRQGEKQVRSYTPEKGKSTQEGQGIGLFLMKESVENGGGIFNTYTDVLEKGATTTISFPLIRVSE